MGLTLGEKKSTLICGIMDFLDPVKQRRHRTMLFIGYGLVAIAVALATIILVYAVYGFGLDRNGQVVQNGLVYFSSAPEGGSIYVDGKLLDNKTNTKAAMPAGQYDVRITRDGYQAWQRSISVDGSIVSRFDYPFLFPKDIKPVDRQKFSDVVTFATQSRDRRWLLVAQPGNIATFNEFDLRDSKKAARQIVLPDALMTLAGTQSLELIEWSSNNRHVLVKHTFEGGSEYVLIDRTRPEESINLSQRLKLVAQTVTLIDGAFDEYYLYDQPTLTLSRTKLNDLVPTSVLTNVLGFKSYADDTVLFTTPDTKKDSGNVLVKLRDGDKNYTMRTIAADGSYLLNMARYDGDMLVTVGSPKESRVYVYRNPIDDLNRRPQDPLVPLHVLKVAQPLDVSFSTNARFVMAQRQQDFYVYDAETDKGYLYTSKLPVDDPQLKASWMDGHRLTYVSGGKLVVFDFDSINQRVLQTADARFLPFFDPQYRYVYTFNATTQADKAVSNLQQTPLKTPDDL